VAADRRVLDPQTVAQAERLREITRCDLNLMATLAQTRDHRPHHEHVRRVGEVDPDLHEASPGAGGVRVSNGGTAIAASKPTGRPGALRFDRYPSPP